MMMMMIVIELFDGHKQLIIGNRLINFALAAPRLRTSTVLDKGKAR